MLHSLQHTGRALARACATPSARSLHTSRSSALLAADKPTPAAPAAPANAAANSATSAASATAAAATVSASGAARPSSSSSGAPVRQTGNTASDLRRIYRERQRQAEQTRELFPWEQSQTKVTAWEPKYEDEKKFFYAGKVQEDQHNLDGKTFARYLGGFGSRYLLSKQLLPSGRELNEIDMTNQKQLHLEMQMSGNTLHYWYMNLQTKQRPAATVKTSMEGAKSGQKVKAPKVLKVNLSKSRAYDYLTILHELWPRKDERDYAWRKLPRRSHGQYRIDLQRVLAEGPSKPLNVATQSFIDHLRYQLTFHFRESKRQNRNLHWLQFMGVPGIKISKKHGGEIPVPTLRAA